MLSRRRIRLGLAVSVAVLGGATVQPPPQASAGLGAFRDCGYVDFADGAHTGVLSARATSCRRAAQLVWMWDFQGRRGAIEGTRWRCATRRATTPGAVQLRCGSATRRQPLQAMRRALVVRQAAGVIKCAGFTQITPRGNFEYTAVGVSVLGGVACQDATGVLRDMVLADTVLGGGYGEYRSLGKSNGFTCRGRKAAVHYQELVCTQGTRRIHGFLSGDWLPALNAVASGPSAARLPVFEQGSGVVLAARPPVVDAKRNVRPGSISGLDTWGRITWRAWGGQRAAGTGIYFWQKTDGSGFREYPSRLTLYRQRRCGAFRIYTRIRGTFTGARPPGMPRRVVVRAYPYNDC